ncbi:MAG: hemerythrin family protein [Magnetococcales bacterium]|nr:hemerythrin family protein [Magnetococcales bacterium]NGZ05281.1 hemerythrin family protein [Magnetococcales bacterium]
MNTKIETLEWVIWTGFAAFVGLMGWIFGLAVALAMCLSIPFVIMLKNDFIRRRFTWQSDYSVGITVLDEDHKRLFELIFEMYKSMQKAYGKEDAARILTELQEYTITHFDREEAVMQKHGYPELESHRREHEVMKEKVNHFSAALAANSMEVSKDVVRFLQNWLINHINKTDKAYSAFLTAKGER